jgi:hypothetical protein
VNMASEVKDTASPLALVFVSDGDRFVTWKLEHGVYRCWGGRGAVSCQHCG